MNRRKFLQLAATAMVTPALPAPTAPSFVSVTLSTDVRHGAHEVKGGITLNEAPDGT